jgi:hypothetical protein
MTATDTPAILSTWTWFLRHRPLGFETGYRDALRGRFEYDHGTNIATSWYYEEGHKLGMILKLRGAYIRWPERTPAPEALLNAVRGLRGDG